MVALRAAAQGRRTKQRGMASHLAAGGVTRMTTASDPHGWFRRQLPPYMAGLLSELEEQRFLEHRAQCLSCRQAFDEFTASDEVAPTEGGAHIPAAMIARWPQANRELVGLERALVRAHLKRCRECRGDLERVGYTPELEVVPGLEAELRESGWRAWFSGGQPRSGAARIADREFAAGGPTPVRPRRDWVPWALGGWATAATTAVILLVVNPQHRSAVHVSAPPPATSAAVATPRLVLDSAPAASVLRGTTRSASTAATTIRLGSEARFVRFAMPELYLPDTATVDLSIVGPEGTSLARLRCRSRDLNPPHALLLGHPDVVLAPGTYQLTVAAPFAAEPVVGIYEFRLIR